MTGKNKSLSKERTRAWSVKGLLQWFHDEGFCWMEEIRMFLNICNSKNWVIARKKKKVKNIFCDRNVLPNYNNILCNIYLRLFPQKLSVIYLINTTKSINSLSSNINIVLAHCHHKWPAKPHIPHTSCSSNPCQL